MPKFLVLRFSSIGDIVLTTPVVRCLKRQLTNAEIHFATKKIFSTVIDGNPNIDKKFYLEDNLPELIRQLKKEKYDYIIDLHNNIRTLAIKLQLGVKSFSFNKLNFEKWLMVNFKIDRLPPVHIVDRYMATVKNFGVTNDGKGLDYFISSEDERVLEKFPSTHQQGYIGFVIGAKHFTKQLPAQKIISICKKISQPIILLGGKEDAGKAEIIMRESSSQIFNACGKFTLNESAALIKHSTKIISHDTGLMHIAAAFKKDIISVWGNTIPEFGMSPYLPGNNSSVFEVKNLSCRPCSKIGFDSCPKKHFDCMNKINVDDIVKAVLS